MVNAQQWSGPAPLLQEVEARLSAWEAADGTRRLWARDAALWTGTDEARWLGWLDVVEPGRRLVPALTALAGEARREGFTHALLLGMGGSSLCPEVLARTFGTGPGGLELHVLDSTDPAQVLALESRVDLDRTLVVVASKSGSTLEPNVFLQYFFARVAHARGDRGRAGRQFVAITDPGSKLERAARADGFRAVIAGEPTIGGRFSALSPFGLVPAALLGLDPGAVLDAAGVAVAACGPDRPGRDNPGVALGLLLGTAARAGRDKLTILASPAIAGLGAWLEQLIAESTGKAGTAIVPVDLETPDAAATYGSDRLFAYLRLGERPDARQDAHVASLEAAGHPVIRIDLPTRMGLFQEFFRWEIATAVAGTVLGINPFDQPDVEASKVATRALTSAYERDGSLPAETAMATGGGLALFTDEANATALRAAGGGAASVATLVRAHLARLAAGDYFALLAYVEMTTRHTGVLQRIRDAVRRQRGVATCLGFGPRFLHSTGQAYKGGPNTGVFLQVTCDDARDVEVPGQRYSFGTVKAAQARGDFDVLADRGRRALRVHVGPDVAAGLETLAAMVEGRDV
jgi:glucose-6-phosphate isomerase